MLLLHIDLYNNIKCKMSIRNYLHANIGYPQIPHIETCTKSDKKHKRKRPFTYFKCTGETPPQLVCL